MVASNPLNLSDATRFERRSFPAHSTSPDRSPLRKSEFTAQELDPLLRNLSPDSTLRALTATDLLSATGQKEQDELSKSIANASPAERALGIKAALAAKIIRQWHAEVSSWHWPDPRYTAPGAGFQPPNTSDSANEKLTSDSQELYMGSLRAQVVRNYEARIEQIKDGLEALNVEELKEHVLDAHIPSRSRPGTSSSAHATLTTSGHGHLGDLTAVITATILHALPHLAELNMLISIWDVRIAVLFGIPELLHSLETTKAAVEEALRAVRGQGLDISFTPSQFETTKESLQHDVSSAGVQIDRALDILEGREDSLPNAWIEEMDDIESSFGDWVVEAKQKLLQTEWHRQNRTGVVTRRVAGTVPLSGDRPQSNTLQEGTAAQDSDQRVDVEARDLVPETRPQLKEDTIREHSALEAFKHRPIVRSASKRSAAESNGSISRPSTSGHDADVAIGRPQAKVLQPRPEDQVDINPVVGHVEASRLSSPDSPRTEISSQQQARLADLIALNNSSTIADDGRREGFASQQDHTDETPKAEPREPFQFPMRRTSDIQSQQDQKPPLRLDLPSTAHQREISEVSLAGSAFSETFSDISNAEIVDATTQVLASPKINLVDNPFRTSRDDLSDFVLDGKGRVQSMQLLGKDVDPVEPIGGLRASSKSLSLNSFPSQDPSTEVVSSRPSVGTLERDNNGNTYYNSPPRASIVHRASTASIEVIPRGHVRRVDSHRRSSHDMYNVSPIDLSDTPADALRKLTASDSVRSVSSHGTERPYTPIPDKSSSREGTDGSDPRPLQLINYRQTVTGRRTATPDSIGTSPPLVPPRSSKRQSRDLEGLKSPISSADIDASSVSSLDETPTVLPSTFSPFKPGQQKSASLSIKPVSTEETLEAKIQHILTSLPTRIRLTSDSESSGSPINHSSTSSTRSSTPTPSLTLSPVRQERSTYRSNAKNSEVKVYHLVRSGQPRDTPPTKLHVRLVGEHGERVMVRVGGGWADLAEYLREYSLHHGKRTQDGKFEVANLPAGGVKQNDTLGSSPSGPMSNGSKSRSVSRPDPGFDFGNLPSIQPRKTRVMSASKAVDNGNYQITSDQNSDIPSRPPPVPIIPSSYRNESQTTNSSREPSVSTSTTISHSTPRIQSRNSTTTNSPTITTTSTIRTPASNTGSSPSYTPLGAAGPKGGINIAKSRAATFGSPVTTTTSNPENEAWVQGMVGKARQVSAGHINSSHVTAITGPGSTSVTTSISTPTSRKVSAVIPSTPTTDSPDSEKLTNTPSPLTGKANVDNTRPKSRMSSFGDVGGIRRVFLRSKKDR